MTRILVVEDEPDIAAMIAAILNRAGYGVAPAPDGKTGLRIFHREPPDLVLLDIGLPDVDGWEVLTRIRDASDVPVMMLTAYSTEEDTVRGLRGGADDYLTKPFGAQELVARVEALLRRAAAADPLEFDYDDGLVAVDVGRREVRIQGRPVTLTPTEFQLLSILVRNQGKVLGNRLLLTRVWDDSTGLAPERVKYTVRRLRRKLGWSAGDDGPLTAVRGVGYRYRAPDRHERDSDATPAPSGAQEAPDTARPAPDTARPTPNGAQAAPDGGPASGHTTPASPQSGAGPVTHGGPGDVTRGGNGSGDGHGTVGTHGATGTVHGDGMRGGNGVRSVPTPDAGQDRPVRRWAMPDETNRRDTHRH